MEKKLNKIIKRESIEIITNKKIKRYIRKAYKYAAKKSTDENTWTGALIIKNNRVISKGANKYPKKIKIANIRKKEKYCTQDHAERNAIYKCSKKGISTKNATMISPWIPCYSCAVAIINSGIKKLIIHYDISVKTPKDWENELLDSLKMLSEAGIKIKIFKGKIGKCKSLFRGKKWSP